jgi:hypothetical protein
MPLFLLPDEIEFHAEGRGKMADQIFIKGYLSKAVGASASFTIEWIGDNSFVLSGLPAGVTGCSFISRLDFYDYSGKLWMVVPCTSSCPGAASSQCSYMTVTGSNTVEITVALESLLSQSIQMHVKFETGLDPKYSKIKAPSFSLGGGDKGPLYYDDVINLLQSRGNIETTRYGTDPSADTLFNQIINPSLTTAPRSTPFGSDHVTTLVRHVTLADGTTILNVLTLRRGFTGFTEPNPVLEPRFRLAIDLDGSSSSYIHATQFPSVDWLDLQPGANTPLADAVTFHVEISGFTRQVVYNFWQDKIRGPYLAGLRSINDPLDLSLLPSFPVDASTAQRDFLWRLTYTISPSAAAPLISSRLQPYGYLDAEDQSTPAAITYSCQLTALTGDDDKPVTFATASLNLGSPVDAIANDNFTELHGMVFGLTGLTTAQRLRLGALDVDLAANELTGKSSRLTVRVMFEVNPSAEGDWIPRVRLDGLLPVARFGPGGEDAAPASSDFVLSAETASYDDSQNFQRAAPIIIDAAATGLNRGAAAAYSLNVGEWTRGTRGVQAQQIVLTLDRETATADPPLQVLVLDREPFLVALVKLQAESTSDGTSEVGTWCNLFPEGPGWRLRAGAQGSTLFLPPQAVGEAMVKGSGNVHEPSAGQQVDFRFSPLATVNLQAAINDQNAVEPSWNTRRIFGYPGQTLPGTELDPNKGTNFELLYGMSTTVVRANLRLAEIFARLGELPGPMPDLSAGGGYTAQQQSTYEEAREAWGRLYKQTLSRPNVLELWDDHVGGDLTLDDGVQYQLRTTADTIYPHDTKGTFAGGVGWALDSANVATELVALPNSVAGRLVQPRFTALGGFGTQRATFANGKVIITSRTSLGRIESLTVTLVGRIGVLWNHALHITVYERTVLPSQQFQAQQDELPGSPLLRKTAEYVELLETSRSYPESGNSAITRAFVQGSAFKSQRILVDSRWGGDVGTTGWQVPLWQQGEDGRVYPRPHIGLTVSVDPEVGVDSLTGEVLDPDKLCFYTDTQLTTTADTDTWNSIPEIDYIDQLRADDVEIESQPSSLEPGFGRFTYHLADLPAQVNLVATRVAPPGPAGADPSKTSNAIGSKLKNVSMMRGKPTGSTTQTLTPQQQVWQQVRRGKDWWSIAADRLKQPLNVPSTSSVQQAINDRLDAVNASCIARLQSDLDTSAAKLGSACDAIAGRLNSSIDRSADSLQSIVKDVLVDLPNQAKASLEAIFKNQGAALGGDLSAEVTRFFAGVRATLTSFTGNFTGIVNVAVAYGQGADSDLGAFQSQISTLLSKINAINDAASATTVQDLLIPLMRNIDGTAGNLRADIDRDGQALSRAVRGILGGSGDKLTAPVDATLDSALNTFNAALEAVIQGVAGSLPIKQTLVKQVTDGLGGLSSAITDAQNAIAAAIAPLQAARSPLETALDNLETALKADVQNLTAATTAELDGKLDTVFQAAGFSTFAADITTWLNQQQAWAPNPANLCAALQQDIAAIKAKVLSLIQNDLGDLVNAAEGDLADTAQVVDAIGQQIGQQIDQITSQVSQSLNALGQQVSGVASAGYAAASPALRTLRAFGVAPQVPNLGFTLPRMAFRFDDTLPYVDMTPVNAFVTQAANGLANDLGSLSQMNVNLPTKSLLDSFIPNNLPSFNLNDIFPSFAGINLKDLFSSVRMPDVGSDALHITHKIDPQTRRATLDADVSIPLPGNPSLFDIGPLTVGLLSGVLTAHVHFQAGVGQEVQRTSSGSIYGDWQVSIGGMVLLSFVKTTLAFDGSGNLRFEITPINVRLTAVLQFLADLLNKLNLGGGLVIHATADPIKVACSLDLPLPDITGGTFGVRNLHLGATFTVGIDDIGFYMEIAANLSRQTAPFTLTIFILGGSGWFEISFKYQAGRVTGMVTLGLGASASLAIALGPINGSVSITYALFAQMQIGTGGGLSLGVMILIAGHVSVLGIVEADVILLLEAEYSAGTLIGRGMFSIKIKICWCFTLEVSKSVEFQFGAAASSSNAHAIAARTEAAALPPMQTAPPLKYEDHRTAASNYIDMLA